MHIVSKTMTYVKAKPSCFQCLLLPAIALLIAGLSLLFLWPQFYHLIININLGLAPDSKVFHVWKKSPNPPFIEIYFHNWTNPEEGHNDSIKPKFQEVGPFRFQEIKEKLNITWNSNNTISYRQKKIWKFDRNGSCCDLSVNITTINAVLVTLSHKVRTWNVVPRLSVNVALKALTPDLHVTKNASELLFEGYVDNLLDLAKSFSSLIPSDRFGWFYGKNDSSIPDGYFNMDVSPSTRGVLKSWNNFQQTPYYQGECGKVFGSAGELYSPGQDRTIASFFSPDMCRNIPLEYVGDVDFYGVPCYKYIAHEKLLDNGTIYSENKCFCNGECMPSGILNVSSCRQGSPSFVSLPHFLHADPIYLEQVEGLKPDKEKHQLYIIIEPNTGLPLQAAARIQMNMHLKPINFMPVINDVPNVVFPVLWFQVESKASEAFASQLKLLFKLPTILKSIAFVFIAISVIIIGIAIYKNRTENYTGTIQEQVPLEINRENS